MNTQNTNSTDVVVALNPNQPKGTGILVCNNCKWFATADGKGKSCKDLGVKSDHRPCQITNRSFPGYFIPLKGNTRTDAIAKTIANMDEGEVYFLKQMIKNREAGIEVEGITNFHIGQKVTWTHSEKDEETKKVVETKYTGTVVGISMANVKVEEDEGKVRWTLLPKALKAVVTT